VQALSDQPPNGFGTGRFIGFTGAPAINSVPKGQYRILPGPLVDRAFSVLRDLSQPYTVLRKNVFRGNLSLEWNRPKVTVGRPWWDGFKGPRANGRPATAQPHDKRACCAHVFVRNSRPAELCGMGA
jgi:hypothetical protein